MVISETYCKNTDILFHCTVFFLDPNKVIEIIHTTTADGTPLSDLDFNELLSSGPNRTYTLTLKTSL